jgi:hypothetical protein
VSDFNVITGVSKTLAAVIHNATGLAVENDKSPADDIAGNVVHLYLYRVEQNPFFVNNDWINPSTTVLRQPPIGLNLFYLITPYGAGQLEIQKTLGEVIRVFHETAIVPPADLDPSLADTTEELRVFLNPLPLEEMSTFWKSFEKRSYRLSLTYKVSVVLIDSRVQRTVQRVEERNVEVLQRERAL